MHVEPWRLKLQAKTAGLMAIAMLIFTVLSMVAKPDCVVQSMAFLSVLLYAGAGTFCGGFAFISFLEAPEITSEFDDDDDWRRGRDDDPPSPPRGPGGRGRHRCEHPPPRSRRPQRTRTPAPNLSGLGAVRVLSS